MFERIGSFDESLSIVHDLDWYLRLACGWWEGWSIFPRERSSNATEPGGSGEHGTVNRSGSQERTVHQRIFADVPVRTADYSGEFSTSRALFFAARQPHAKGDLPFGLVRLAEAFLVSPVDAARSPLGVRLRLRHLPRSAAKSVEKRGKTRAVRISSKLQRFGADTGPRTGRHHRTRAPKPAYVHSLRARLPEGEFFGWDRHAIYAAISATSSTASRLKIIPSMPS